MISPASGSAAAPNTSAAADAPPAAGSAQATSDAGGEVPLFSVIVCCFQAEGTLQRCVESVLACDGWQSIRPAAGALAGALAGA
ncbi:MAG: hypothetical protein ACREJ2_15685, partial [Planctomycetota bacterium]